VFCVGGVGNLYCNWVEFFIELGFNFPTSYLNFFGVVVLFLFRKFRLLL
jgi:hypothetical protein